MSLILPKSSPTSLYSVYGTILEHGVQDKFDAIFAEVHRSHMSKDYSPTKMIKGTSFVEADVRRVLEQV